MINVEDRVVLEFTDNEICFLLRLSMHCNNKMECSMTNAVMEQITGCSSGKLSNTKNSLMQKNAISIVERYDEDGARLQNLYKINPFLLSHK
jgi:hypothetical protein